MSRGRQPIGLVFTIDPDALRAHGPIWDSFDSMRAHHRMFFESDFESMVDLVGKCTVLEAGHLLEVLYEGLSKRSQQYSEDLRLQEPLEHYVEHTVWAHALELLGEQSLSSLCSVSEHACPLRDHGSTTETVIGDPTVLRSNWFSQTFSWRSRRAAPDLARGSTLAGTRQSSATWRRLVAIESSSRAAWFLEKRSKRLALFAHKANGMNLLRIPTGRHAKRLAWHRQAVG
jgi:hypothetical protein